jgi:Tol biopolymer transport system component
MLKPSPLVPIRRFSFTIGEGHVFTNTGRQVITISPDGTQIAYLADQRLYVRAIDDLNARPIPGSETLGAIVNPAFSPDGRNIAFQVPASRTIKRLPLAGGVPLTVCSANAVFGMSWTDNGIFFGQSNPDGIFRVAAQGGTPEQIVKVSPDEIAYGPQLLAGGDMLLFTLAKRTGAGWDKAAVVAQSLSSGERRVLVQDGSDGRYLPSGHLAYAMGGVLLGAPFDPRRLTLTGSGVPIIEGIRRSTPTPASHYAFSNDGSLVYLPGSATGSTDYKLTRVDINGVGAALNVAVAPYDWIRSSRDGRYLAVSTDDGRIAAVWIYELDSTAAIRRLTFGGRDRAPVWSPDGSSVAFQSDRDGDVAIFRQRIDGTGLERLTKSEAGTTHTPTSWSPDGKHLLFTASKNANDHSLYVLSLADKTTSPVGDLRSRAPIGATFSRDGRWIAYQLTSDESNALSIWVRPFPLTEAMYRIGAGVNPFWSIDGQTLYFNQRGQLVAVTVTTHPTFAFSTPKELALGRLGYTERGPIGRNIDILPDGHFVGVISAGQLGTDSISVQQINVVLNWFEDIRQRLAK